MFHVVRTSSPIRTRVKTNVARHDRERNLGRRACSIFEAKARERLRKRCDDGSTERNDAVHRRPPALMDRICSERIRILEEKPVSQN